MAAVAAADLAAEATAATAVAAATEAAAATKAAGATEAVAGIWDGGDRGGSVRGGGCTAAAAVS
jgi:hypothetical protein